MDTRETVTELLQRIGRGDPEKIAELYAEKVDWRLDWPAGDWTAVVPWIQERNSRAGVAEHFRLIGQHHVAGATTATVDRVLVDGQDAVVLGTLTNTAKPTGRPYESAFALHVTVQDGEIVRHHVYEDSLAVWTAFAPAAAATPSAPA